MIFYSAINIYYDIFRALGICGFDRIRPKKKHYIYMQLYTIFFYSIDYYLSGFFPISIFRVLCLEYFIFRLLIFISIFISVLFYCHAALCIISLYVFFFITVLLLLFIYYSMYLFITYLFFLFIYFIAIIIHTYLQHSTSYLIPYIRFQILFIFIFYYLFDCIIIIFITKFSLFFIYIV